MRFNIRFYIGNRLGAASRYSLIEFCIHCVDRYGLKEKEVEQIVTLKIGSNAIVPKIMAVERIT